MSPFPDQSTDDQNQLLQIAGIDNRRKKMQTRVLCLMALSVFGLAACQPAQQSAANNATPAKPPVTTEPSSATATVAATNAWSRATPPGAPVAGGYVTLHNQAAKPDRLLAVESSASAQVEIHEMSMDGGMMKMRRLDDGLALPAGQDVVLGPGGIHLMFIAPHVPFEVGQPVTATLIFEHAPRVDVRFDIRAMGASEPADGPNGEHMR
ncbi:copper chaperone PCu(A)C [Xanthomonas arboricola]|uniref:copper chaperone PCu(A)C n=1 Tax=Xanthomonas arboricola TaxID=56448 RepID=UPI0032E8CC9E